MNNILDPRTITRIDYRDEETGVETKCIKNDDNSFTFSCSTGDTYSTKDLVYVFEELESCLNDLDYVSVSINGELIKEGEH